MSEKNYKGTVLIVEDNPLNLKLVKDVLEYQGFKVIEANDGKQGLDSVKKNKNEIDIILMDLQLPKINGIEVIKLIKSDSTTKHIPVIVISAYAMDSDIEKARKAGCNNYITKPINIEDFMCKIDAVFRHNGK